MPKASAHKRIKNHIIHRVNKQAPAPDPMASRSTSLPIRAVPMYVNHGDDFFFEEVIRRTKQAEQEQLEEDSKFQRPSRLPLPVESNPDDSALIL